jgi:ATP-dependent RNA helicase DeaD
MKQLLMSAMTLVLGLVLVNSAEAKDWKNRGKSRSGHSRASHHSGRRGSNKRLSAAGKRTRRGAGKAASIKGSRRVKGKGANGTSAKGKRRAKGKGANGARGKGAFAKGKRRVKGKGANGARGKGAFAKGKRRAKGKGANGARGKGAFAKRNKGARTKGGRLKSGKGRKLSARDRAKIRRARHKLKDARARRALLNMARGEGLDGGELDDITDALDALDDEESELDEDEQEAILEAVSAAREAIAQAAGAAAEDANGEIEAGDESEPASLPVKQTQRYLRVANATAKDLTVFVQYRTQTEGAKFAWLPADPGDSQDAVSFVIPAGTAMYLDDGDVRINASRVRLWAEGGPKKWAQYQSQDLWLVPEEDEQGEHVYYAPEMKTSTYTFRP